MSHDLARKARGTYKQPHPTSPAQSSAVAPIQNADRCKNTGTRPELDQNSTGTVTNVTG
ncbi:hypothetical protein H6G97_36560 [Nostoc flagelliforme FACHB-838]|uniref:Uncharacterized protein n=1 Tax=Nostoc flagelliforme FACHB-838 TaxID=2692904 RepID=A0ABR8DZV9_9NOSO|nr:hypothetical protein [Nostoc flagelliforme]MBD2534693.1 hypothetical protein [Nostoc flagelliforme FACHB-838]